MWSIFFFLNARQKLSDILLLIFSNIFPFFVIEIITRPHFKKTECRFIKHKHIFFFTTTKTEKDYHFFSVKTITFLKIYIFATYIFISYKIALPLHKNTRHII